MRKIGTILILLVAMATSLVFEFEAKAQQDPATAIALSRELNKMQWFALSFYLLDREMAKRPESKDLFLVQKAQTYFAQGKAKQAELIINKIPSTSTAYMYSRLVLGMGAFQKGDCNMAKIPLKAYLENAVKNLPKPNEKGKIKEYQTAIAYLKAACEKLGDAKGAAEAMNYVTILREYWAKLANNGKEPAQQNKNEKILMTAQAILDTVENMKKNGKEGWKEQAQAQIKPLTELYWNTQYLPMAAVEKGRAYCLLERYEDGFKEIKKFIRSIKGLDDWYKENNQVYMAPAAKAYVWLGFCALGLGDKASDDAEKKKQYNLAAKCFIKFFTNYEPKKSPQTKKAVLGFNQAKDALAKLGEKVSLPQGIELPASKLDQTQADALFMQKKYKEAIPLYLELLRSPGARTSPQAPDLIMKLAYCYARNDDRIEAMALVGYEAECFPDADPTSAALLNVGTTFWNAYKAATNPEQKKELMNDAIWVYKIFLTTCPTNDYADEVALQIANVAYKNATDMALEANKMPLGPEKIKKNEEARNAFKDAIPAYQYIVDNFLHTDIGKSSAFYLGCCYTNSRQYKKGADVYLKFAEAEINREKKDKRDLGQVADSKIRAAENYVQCAISLDKEAKKLLADAENAPEGKPADGQDGENEKEKAPGAPETAEELKNKAAEKEAEAKKYFLLAIQHANELLNAWVKPDGPLANVTAGKQKKKLEKAMARAYNLIPWAYDGSKDTENAIRAFATYIKKYPDDKGIPKSMARLGMLYVEDGKPNEAAQVFNTLTAKYPEEGKKVLPKMARTMYDLAKYDKAIAAVQKIFEKKPDNVSVGNLRWIAKNLSDCGGKHLKEGSALALQACDILRKKLDPPNWTDWMGKQKGKEIAADQAAQEKWIKILKEQINVYAATAGYWSENYAKAEKALTTVLANPNTPYFFEASFLRAKARRKQKKYQLALDDYAEISKTILGNKNLARSLFFKTQALTGDTYVEMKEFGKAANAYSMAAMALLAKDASPDNAAGASEDEKKTDPAELKKQDIWLQHATFMLASCLKATQQTDGIEKWAKAYRKRFPTGKFRGKIASPPAPEVALQEAGTK